MSVYGKAHDLLQYRGFPVLNGAFTKRLQSGSVTYVHVTWIPNASCPRFFRFELVGRGYSMELDGAHGSTLLPPSVILKHPVERFPGSLPCVLLLIKPPACRADAFPIHGQCENLGNGGGEALCIVGQDQVLAVAVFQTLGPQRGGHHWCTRGPSLQNLDTRSTSRQQRDDGDLGLRNNGHRVFHKAGNLDVGIAERQVTDGPRV